MHSETWLCKKALNQLHYSMKNMITAEKMLQEKRPPQDIFCQLRASEGGIQKIIYEIFDEANRKCLATRINLLLDSDKLTAEQAETLAHIQKQLGSCTIKVLLKHELTVRKIEEHLL